ncbi:alpha/beta fold hydrolase [Paractinoplanes rishiriensis]|uniref:Alpha/beta hydrolase n=1 Tax=Paractinoplanes rishiriensis TaxID=1050105 RepID=A0A919MNE3_9ACTN|nr:hypothetical protein [Actinoplanes rishiriensis]GIE93936.1 hypothetical protein Ari01nite_14010 [Actinoplanes rishiriensis]
MHGAADRVVPAGHGAWLARHRPEAEWREVAGAGHLSVLPAAAVSTLEWLGDREFRKNS